MALQQNNMEAKQLVLFNECRPVLLSLATRILGNESEAEDIVQEAYLRWRKTDLSQVKSPKAFLTTTLTRLCLNQLNLARVRLHEGGTPLAPEDVRGNTPGPDQNAELADALTQAFTRMLTNLSPTETAVFLLREAFDFDYAEIAPIVERSAGNCRQILKRARERIASNQARYETPVEQNQRMARLFREAVTTGELESLLDVLSGDAVLMRDGGDLSRPAPPALSGLALRQELRNALGRMKAGSSRLVFSGRLSGEHLVLAEHDGHVLGALLFKVKRDQIRSIRVVTCPALLRQVRILLACQFSEAVNH